MNLPITPPFPPMEAKQVESIPEGDKWGYEPKWDGFRCIVFRDGDDIELQSKACKPLARYFPDVVEAMRALPANKFVMDGELVIPFDGSLSFEHLLLRIHPAASRVNKLAARDAGVVRRIRSVGTGARQHTGGCATVRAAGAAGKSCDEVFL